MKNLLLDYLELLKDQIPKSDEEVLDNYENYIGTMGSFMMKYYRFSNFAGPSIITYFLIVFFVSTLIGFLFSLFFNNSFVIHISIIIISVLGGLLRLLVKHKTKRIFGFRF